SGPVKERFRWRLEPGWGSQTVRPLPGSTARCLKALGRVVPDAKALEFHNDVLGPLIVMRGWRLIVRVSHDPVVALLLLHPRLVADVSQSLDQVGLGQGTVHDNSLQMALPDSRLVQCSGMSPEKPRFWPSGTPRRGRTSQAHIRAGNRFRGAATATTRSDEVSSRMPQVRLACARSPVPDLRRAHGPVGCPPLGKHPRSSRTLRAGW